MWLGDKMRLGDRLDGRSILGAQNHESDVGSTIGGCYRIALIQGLNPGAENRSILWAKAEAEGDSRVSIEFLTFSPLRL